MQKAKGPKIVSHTTLIDAAAPLVKYAASLPTVDRVAPGFLKTGIKKLRSHQSKVKFTHQEGFILLQVRGNISVQEVRVYSKDTQTVLEAMARYAVDNDYRIEFGVDEVAERKKELRQQQALTESDKGQKKPIPRRRMR